MRRRRCCRPEPALRVQHPRRSRQDAGLLSARPDPLRRSAWRVRDRNCRLPPLLYRSQPRAAIGRGRAASHHTRTARHSGAMWMAILRSRIASSNTFWAASGMASASSCVPSMAARVCGLSQKRDDAGQQTNFGKRSQLPFHLSCSRTRRRWNRRNQRPKQAVKRYSTAMSCSR